MLYPFLFKPIFQERIWGGRSLERLYGKAIPARVPIGESWEISDRADAQSEISNGSLAGRTLEWLMRNHRSALLGKARALDGRFPLLVKILDAREKLSLQVHPPAAVAKALGGDPKTEMWFITEAQPGADLYVGLKKGATRGEFERRIGDGSVEQCFHRVPVRSGDAMFLPSGRVHAIGSGLVIFEIQQNSDTTYRVFDWNRVDPSGKPRQLHIRESLESIDFTDFEPGPVQVRPSTQPGVRVLVDDPLFRVELATLKRGDRIVLELPAARVLAGVRGQVTIAGHETTLASGVFCLCPAELGRIELSAADDAEVLLAEPGS